jgi:hypothetical protein
LIFNEVELGNRYGKPGVGKQAESKKQNSPVVFPPPPVGTKIVGITA